MLRAVPFAAVCTLSAAAGHSLAMGAPVPIWALGLGLGLAWGLAVLCGRRERSLGAVCGGLAVGEVALHVLFHLAQSVNDQVVPGATGAGTAGMANMPGMTGIPMPAGTPMSGLSELVQPFAGAVPPWSRGGVLGMTPFMLVAHLCAALAAGWWLRCGEAAVWRLIRLGAEAAQEHAAPLRSLLGVALALMCGPVRPALCRPAPAAGCCDSPQRPPVSAPLRHVVIRRGPPWGRAAV